jgi:hypothetical protein
MRKASILPLLAALTASNTAGAQTSVPATVVSAAAEQTQFRLTLGDGRVMRSPELIGAKLIVATETGPVKVQIAAVERDADAKSGDVWLHTLPAEEHLYNTCTRKVRVDYAGQGQGATRNGMSIDMFDDLGIEKADNDPKRDFEAAGPRKVRSACDMSG